MRKNQLLAYLKGACSGRRYTVKGAELEQVLHLSGTDLRKLVNRLRQDGVPICSSREGYFYARNAGEIYTTIRSLKDMMYGLSQAVDGLEGALESFGEEAGGSP